MQKIIDGKDVIAKRRWRHNQALANSLQEGFEPTAEYLAMCEKVIQGEMTSEQVLERILPSRKPGPKLLVYQGGGGQWYWFIQGAEGERVDARGGFANEAEARQAGQPVFDSYRLDMAA